MVSVAAVNNLILPPDPGQAEASVLLLIGFFSGLLVAVVLSALSSRFSERDRD